MLKRLKHLALALALLLAPADAFAQSQKLSNLSAGAAVAGTDLFYDVQTVGAGGVQVTANQLKTFVSGLTIGTTTITGGANGQVLFNSAGTLGSDAGMTYGGLGQFNLLLGTITTNNKAVNITATWNNAATTFDAPLFVNVTNTASAIGSVLMDLQLGGTSLVSVDKFGGVDSITVNAPGGNCNICFGGIANGTGFLFASSTRLFYQSAGSPVLLLGQVGGTVQTNATGAFQWSNTGGDASQAADTSIARRGAAGVLSIQNPGSLGSATAWQAYNTVDTASGTPTNFERGTFDFTTTANTLTIGTQAGGTGVVRPVNILGGPSTEISMGGLVSNQVLVIAGNVNSLLISGSAMTINSGTNTRWASSNDATTGVDTGLARTVGGVLEINNGSSGTLTGTYLHWGGQARVTADVTNATTTLATITGLSVTVVAGRTYCFVGELSWTDAAAGGLQLAISGTSTATNIIYDGYIVDSAANGIKGNAQAVALGGVVASSTTTGTAGHARVSGCDTVNAGGTLLMQFAENTTNATATTIKRGSYFYVYDSP